MKSEGDEKIAKQLFSSSYIVIKKVQENFENHQLKEY